MSKDIAIRFATAEDTISFASWAASNPDIPESDITAVSQSKIPMVLVVEIDGEAELYLPLLPALTIGFLGFKPNGTPRNKATALKAMLTALRQFMTELSIDDAYVFTKANYPMGKWALKNGFKQKEKDGFTLERTHVQ